MGKYRTRVYTNASSASGSCNSGTSVLNVNPHPSHLSKNYGNCVGKFEGNLGQSQSPHKIVSPKRRIRLVALYAFVLGFSIVFTSVQEVSSQGQKVDENGNTTLGNESHNCTHPSAEDFPADIFSMEAKLNGAIVFHFLVSIYLFYALLLVCDEYFVPAVESICRALQIPSDVAGATFMAISTSAPELFTNVIGTFLTNGDMGVGTIVGSAVFNILAVGACCGIWAGYSLATSNTGKVGVHLEWWPLTRDSLFYLASVGTLIIILYDRKVYWSDALFMLSLYGMYILVLCFNSRIKVCVEKLIEKCSSTVFIAKEQDHRISMIVGNILHANEKTPLLLSVSEKRSSNPDNNNDTGDYSSFSSMQSKEYAIPAKSLDHVLIHNALTLSSDSISSPMEECSQCCVCTWSPTPNSSTTCGCLKGWTEWVISWPIRFLLYFTIPDCRVYRLRNWYWATLVMCIAWIGGLTYVISWMVTIIGDTFSIPDSVTGLTLLASGTSIPEVVSSLIVARQGLGSMGFSNTIGSNTFDVLVCLGLPWLIKSALLSSQEVNYIEIHSGGLEYSAVILISALLILYFAIAFNGFILDKKIGIMCVVIYVVFISFACMLEMNVFFPVNLPPC